MKKQKKEIEKNIDFDDDDLYDIDDPNEELRVKLKGLKIPKDNPFKNDGLGREKVAKMLTKFISYSEQGKVLALNGEWGTGKTTFIEMWMQALKNAKYPVVYYNAWEDDLSDEPLISMVRNLSSLSDNGAGDLDKLVEVAGKVIVGALFGALKSAAGIWGDIAEGAVKGGADVIQKNVEKSLSNNDSSTTSLLREFKKELGYYVASICETGYQAPLVYFIDELDRCNPTFAVKVLERIKHLFEVPNVVFVLSVDKKQFAHSINGYFGSEQFDAIDYLRRFIDIEFCLPEPPAEKTFECFYERLGNKAIDDVFKPANGMDSLSAIKTITRYRHLSLRQIERIFGLVNSVVIQYKFDEEENGFTDDFKERMDLFFFIAYLKVCENEIYDGIRLLKYTLKGVRTELEKLIPEQVEASEMVNQMDSLSITIYRLLEGYYIELEQYQNQMLDDSDGDNTKEQQDADAISNVLIKKMKEIGATKLRTSKNAKYENYLNTKSIRPIMEKMDFIGDSGIG